MVLIIIIDYVYTGPHTRIFTPNLPSAYQHPNITDNTLSKEVAEHRMAGPLPLKVYTVQELVSSQRRVEAGA